MKKPELKFSKDKINDFANAVGNATKNAVTTVSDNVKESSEQFGKHIDKVKFENDRKKLCPIFEDELFSEEYQLPPMIRIVDYDKRRDNKACEGAVGFETNTKDMKALNIYVEHVDRLGLTFYPRTTDSVYYVDPCDSHLYINLEDYFSYLKKARVDELETIAQTLGAKHVKISLKEQSKSSSTRSRNLSMGLKRKMSMGVSADECSNEMCDIEIAAEVDFKGRDTPAEPRLVYFKNESDINALVKMRLNPDNQNMLLSKTYSFKYSNSSGIQVKQAVKIEEALSQMNCKIGASISNEALNESRIMLEYNIVFNDN